MLTQAQSSYNSDDRKYRDDRVFQKINKKYLTLDESRRRINNEHLKSVIEGIFIPLMKMDELFALLYKRIMYGGSFYKGTKYGLPDEFDLDIVLKLPINYSKIKIDTDHDDYGFVKIKMDKTGPLHSDWGKHSKILNSWITHDNYFDQDKFNRWMQKIFEGSFMQLSEKKTLESKYIIKLHNECNYEIKYTKSGPAFTVIIYTPDGSKIDIDIVPALEFNNVELGNGYKKLNGFRNTWMVVAKPLSEDTPNRTILWRLCFYEQEKELLQGELKPVIRMMKKYRDSNNWKSIVSYFIETIFYHELEAHQDNLNYYLKHSNLWLFVNGLRKLKNALTRQRLEYFWHSNHNLFGKIKPAQLENYANTLQKHISLIDRNIEQDGNILAKVVLTPQEYINFITHNDINYEREPPVTVEETSDSICAIS